MSRLMLSINNANNINNMHSSNNINNIHNINNTAMLDPCSSRGYLVELRPFGDEAGRPTEVNTDGVGVVREALRMSCPWGQKTVAIYDNKGPLKSQMVGSPSSEDHKNKMSLILLNHPR